MTNKEYKSLKMGDKVFVYQFDKVEVRKVGNIGGDTLYLDNGFFVAKSQAFKTEAEAYKYAIKEQKREIAFREGMLKEAKKELAEFERKLAKLNKEGTK